MAATQALLGLLAACFCVLCLPFCECQFEPTTEAPDSLWASSVTVSKCVSTTEGASLTYLVDTTGSMGDDLPQLKIANDWLLDRVSARFPCGVRTYTMVEFNDPGVGPSYGTYSKAQFAAFFQNLMATGGGDCPELAMTGLKLALETSPPNSFILVLTDASALDYNDTDILNDIYSLISTKQSQISFLITGLCGGLDDPQFLIYRDISLRSFGHVFQVSLVDLGKVFYYLELTLSRPINSSTPLFSGDSDISGTYSRSFQVLNPYTELILTADGMITSVSLVGPNDREVELKEIISESWGLMYQVESPPLGNWIMTITATNPHGIRVEAFTATNTSTTARCSDCHSNATCEAYFGGQECVCKDGFIGDGFSCSDDDECAYSWSNRCGSGYCVNTIGSYTCSCYSGYILDAGNICRDINECLRPDLNSCHPLATCINTDGYYNCICPPGYYGDGYSCEPNECTATGCGPGKDCVKTVGSFSCFDPCLNHTVLNEFWRSSSYALGPMPLNCDDSKKGWYRFTGIGGVRMPDACVPQYQCSTHAPMWVNGAHPTLEDGIVTRTACAHWSSGCCTWSTSIQIKMCPGGFYVYNITGTPTCYLTYCTDPEYQESQCSCTTDEECREVNGVWGCFCKRTNSSTDIASLQPQLKCRKNEFGASFPICQLENLGYNTSSLWLKDSNCVGVSDRNDTNLITFMHPLRAGQCGTELMVNATHATYMNTIFLSKNVDPIITREGINITYSCTYPLDMTISLLSAQNPMSSSISISFGGTGELKLSMAIYRDQSYLSPYEGDEVSLSTKDILYVGIMLDGGDTSQFMLVMRNCYATPTNNASDPIKYYIIKDSCPNMQDPTIHVSENGVSTNGRFSVQIFKFIGNYNFVYLHCETKLCDVRNSPCMPSCSGSRYGSGNDNGNEYRISAGPLRRSDPSEIDSSNDPSESFSSNGIRTHWMILTVVMVTLGRQILL